MANTGGPDSGFPFPRRTHDSRAAGIAYFPNFFKAIKKAAYFFILLMIFLVLPLSVFVGFCMRPRKRATTAKDTCRRLPPPFSGGGRKARKGGAHGKNTKHASHGGCPAGLPSRRTPVTQENRRVAALPLFRPCRRKTPFLITPGRIDIFTATALQQEKTITHQW